MDNQSIIVRNEQRKQCYRDGRFYTVPENRHELWLSTKEASWLFEKSSKKQKSLAHTVIKHMVIMNQQAEKGELDAINLLHSWVQAILICHQFLQNESTQLETALSQHLHQQRIYPPRRYRQIIGVSYQSIGLLLNLIANYDHAIWLTGCANNMGVYDKVSHYCRAKAKITEMIYPTLLKVVHNMDG